MPRRVQGVHRVHAGHRAKCHHDVAGSIVSCATNACHVHNVAMSVQYRRILAIRLPAAPGAERGTPFGCGWAQPLGCPLGKLAGVSLAVMCRITRHRLYTRGAGDGQEDE